MLPDSEKSFAVRAMRPIATDWEDSGVADALARLANSCQNGRVQTWMLRGRVDQVAKQTGLSVQEVARARVWCGNLLEEHAADTLDITGGGDGAPRLYFDAYAAAVWTSAHAQYLWRLVEAGSDAETAPIPTLNSVRCASTEYNTSYHLDRGSWTAASTMSMTKDAQILIRLLARSTNPGSRGWAQFFKKVLMYPGTRGIMADAVTSCLTGLHPQLHPSHRPRWATRLLASCAADVFLSDKAELCKCAEYVKEAIRRHIASVLATTPAVHAALCRVRHPLRKLKEPPSDLPDDFMAMSMRAFSQVGEYMAVHGTVGLAEAFKAAFNSTTCSWRTGWMGKGTTTVAPHWRILRMARSVWQGAFQADFVAFWAAAHAHQVRAVRVDATQHEALHKTNSATRLVDALSKGDALAVQRVALQCTWLGLATVDEAARALRLGNAAGGMSASGSPPHPVHIIGAFGPKQAAALLSLARVASVLESVLIVELDNTTQMQQRTALLRHSRRRNDCGGGSGSQEEKSGGEEEEAEESLALLPVHVANLSVCLVCKRVANSFVVVTTDTDESRASAFVEFGTRACQLCVSPNSKVGQVTCAKRASASVKNMRDHEAFMKRRRIENDPLSDNLAESLTSGSFVDSTHSGHLRRDIRTVFSQPRALAACDTRPMARLSLLGKAVRILDHWYALCSFCAAPMRINFSLNWYGGRLCCMRCDMSDFEKGACESSLIKTPYPVHSATRSAIPRCRYCGVKKPRQFERGWKEIKAPHDIAGSNAWLPTPLRRVHYCRSHFRAWLITAHEGLKTRVILSHLSHNARPVFHSLRGDGDDNDAETGRQNNNAATSRRSTTKRKPGRPHRPQLIANYEKR